MIESPVEHTLERTKGLVTERQVERSETTETLLNAARTPTSSSSTSLRRSRAWKPR